MAAFKVGQRVRIIGGPFVGSEATVLGIWRNKAGEECPFVSYPWSVRLDTGYEGPYMACELAPLTDPGAESFLSRIKKLGSEPVNDAPKVTVREGK